MSSCRRRAMSVTSPRVSLQHSGAHHAAHQCMTCLCASWPCECVTARAHIHGAAVAIAVGDGYALMCALMVHQAVKAGTFVINFEGFLVGNGKANTATACGCCTLLSKSSTVIAATSNADCTHSLLRLQQHRYSTLIGCMLVCLCSRSVDCCGAR